MARKQPKKKPRADHFIEFRLNKLHEQFIARARVFEHIMKDGGGIHNVFIMDTVNDLQMLCVLIAAHTDAKRSLRIGLGEEKV